MEILYSIIRFERAFEVSSMGIRVDEEALDKQLTIAGCNDRRELHSTKCF